MKSGSIMTITLHTGGAEGSDWFWEQIGKTFGIQIKVWSFYGHKAKTTVTPTMIPPRQLESADKYIQEANEWFKEKGGFTRKYPNPNPYVNKLLQRDYFIVHNASSVLAIADLDLETGIVSGGTGWGVTIGIIQHKPVYVYSPKHQKWYIYDIDRQCFVQYDTIPVLTPNFAGIGTRGTRVSRGVYDYPRHACEMILRVYKQSISVL